MNPTPGPSGSRGVKPPTQSSAVSSSSGRKKQPKKQKKTTTGFFPMKSEPEAEDGPVEPEKVIIDDEEEQLGVAETFTAYKPSKCEYQIAVGLCIVPNIRIVQGKSGSHIPTSLWRPPQWPQWKQWTFPTNIRRFAAG